MNQILTTEVQSLSLAKQAELLADLEGYVSVPVDIDTFIDDKYYLGNHFGGMWENGKYEGLPKVHPFWRNHLRDIFPNPFYSPYEEINLTGCFSGDTKVDLLDGRSLTFEEIYKEFKDKEFWVLAYNTKTNEWEPSKAYNPRISGYRKLVKITLDNGESFRCTPDHKFLTKDNKWIEAKDIIPNVTSLKSYNRKCDKYSKINLEELKKYWPLIIKNSLNYNHKIISIEYLDKPEFVYNMTVDTYHNYPLNCGIIAKNCIGSGKSTIAIIGSLYDLYRLLLLKNPHSNFGLIQSTLIMVALFTATKSLGKTVLMSQVSDIFEISPFFKSRLTPKKDGQLFPNKIGIIQGSRFLHAVGIAVISGIMDEANESVVSNQALESYNHIRRRMQNRFMSKGGELPCRLWMVSSKKTDNSFLEEHINSKRDDPKTKIIEAAIWEVMRHRGIYSGYSENPPYDIIDHSKFFKVFVGDNNNDPFIIETKEMPSHIEDSRVINVPIEHKQEFISDILGSLRDLGGISSISGYKLFKDREPLLKALIVPPAFTSDIIRLTVEGQDSLKDFLTNYLSSLPNKSAPRYIHFDGAEKHDRFGLSMAYSQGIKEIQRFDALTGKVFTMQEHIVMHDFGVAIEAYPGSEIPWDKIREFIVWLRDILHFNISLITGDTHQSFYMLQLLKKQNFNCEVLSVDRTKDPYFAYKRAITENRVYSPKNDLLLKELFDVEDIGKKIDHSANGSKDLADSIVGSFFSCQENAHSSQLYSNRQIESMKKYLNKSSLFNPKNGRFI